MTGISFDVTLPSRETMQAMGVSSIESLERAMLMESDKASRELLGELRSTMGAAGLGRLGFGLGQTSDLKRTGQVDRRGGQSRASGIVYIRSGSERTRGAIESYTAGSDILPVKGRYLWIATDEIPKKAGRFKMTPALYNSQGFAQRIGPLVQIKGINGNPLLVVRDASVSAAGLPNRARGRTKGGRLRRGQREKALIVAFIGIPRTSRAARINVSEMAQRYANALPERVINRLGAQI